MTSDNKNEVIQFWIRESHRSLESAGREIEAENFRYAVNRMYYALFYLVNAVLFSRGLSF